MPKAQTDSEKKIKTTIDIPEDLWRDFSVKVIQERGGRKKNEVIEALIRKYLKEGDQ